MTRQLPNELTTARLHLREPVLGDAPAIFHAYAQDPQVCRFMVWTPHIAESSTRGFIASCMEDWNTGKRQPYVLTESASDTAIGMVDARLQGSTVDIGYVLAQSHWGQGLMPEAISTLAAAALAQPGIFRVQATCDAENIASQRTLEKAGFAREGRLERHTVHPNISPEPRACFIYAKCR